METLFKQPDKGDPSDIQQHFPEINLQLLCCRYWRLKNWEFNELAFPYWRIYHNDNPGGTIIYNGIEYKLEPGKIALITPNTPYATRLHDHQIPKDSYLFIGNRIDHSNYHQTPENKGSVAHLFIHFNLGSIYDNTKPGVFMFDATPSIAKKIKQITQSMVSNYAQFSFPVTLVIQSFVNEILALVTETTWQLPSSDPRILETLNFIENYPTEDLTNEALANRMSLATNSFTRLFTNELGISPQRYVKKSRINKASILLHHTGKSIDEIASACGFADRYHFSRIFKQVSNTSPARYRKDFKI